MRLVAHRGFVKEYPENTAMACRTASAVADAVEIDVRTAYLYDEGPEESFATVRDLGCDAVYPSTVGCFPGHVRAAHDAGFAANAWTVNSVRKAKRSVGAGVDGSIADTSGRHLVDRES